MLERYSIHVGEIQYTCWTDTVYMLERYSIHVGQIQYTCWTDTVYMLDRYSIHVGQIQYTCWTDTYRSTADKQQIVHLHEYIYTSSLVLCYLPIRTTLESYVYTLTLVHS